MNSSNVGFFGIHLSGVHSSGMHFFGVHLPGVHSFDVHLSGIYFSDAHTSVSTFGGEGGALARDMMRATGELIKVKIQHILEPETGMELGK